MAPLWVAGLFVLIFALYAFGSMILGGMLIFARTGQSGVSVLILTAGHPWWDYPGMLVTFPGGNLELPFFPTVAMVAVSIGVAIGMSVAAVIGGRLIAIRRASAGRPLAAGAIAGFTPAMLALVTMGACCTVTTASAAGLGLVAQTSGTTVDSLLTNNWYLGVFQMLVVFVALLAQEGILIVYGPYLGMQTGSIARSNRPTAELSPLSGRDVELGALRALLVGAAALWSLWGFAFTFTPDGALTSASSWFGFWVGHQAVAGLVVAVALFPQPFQRLFAAPGARRSKWATRGLAAFLGALTVTWLPPAVTSGQTRGLLNMVLGLAGAPAAWGATAPAVTGVTAIALELTLGYALLGGFLIAMAVAPARALDWVAPAATDRTALGDLRSRGIPAAISPGLPTAVPRGATPARLRSEGTTHASRAPGPYVQQPGSYAVPPLGKSDGP